MLQPEPGQVAFFPVIDAIQEFKIESNSPPAEFGRFNGGVVNLTTRAGTNAFHGTGFEFFRHEALNARNYFQPPMPVKPEYRRNQFGGMLGGPLARDRTFFFVDYQGQRQSIGRTVISTVPTLLQRQGIFTEAIAGRVPVIYDPATTARRRRRDAVSGQHHPVGPHRSGGARRCCSDIRCRPPGHGQQLPPDRRTRSTIRISGTSRIDHRLVDARSGVRPPVVLPRPFVPVTPLPDGSGVTTGTLGPAGHDGVGVRVELPAHVLGHAAERAAHRRHPPDASSARRPQLATARRALDIPGIPSTAQVPEHAADLPHRRLPAARIAAEHGVRLQHQRHRDRRHADLGARAATRSRSGSTGAGSA